MTWTNKLTEGQQRVAQQMEYLRANPAFTQLALGAINAWGNNAGVLQYVVTKAIVEAYEAGTRGEHPQVQEPPKTSLIRRTRPGAVPAPEPALEPVQRIRRTRV